MPDDNFVQDLEDGVEKDAEERKRSDILNRLATVNPTLEDLFNVCQNSKLGDVMKTFTLDDLVSTRQPVVDDDDDDDVSAPAPRKKRGKKKAAKKTAKKGPKADKGRPKPRLDYETGMREVLSALQATGQPTGRQAIENATGYTGVQVRTFCKRLATEGKVKILGEGGRSTRYQAV